MRPNRLGVEISMVILQVQTTVVRRLQVQPPTLPYVQICCGIQHDLREMKWHGSFRHHRMGGIAPLRAQVGSLCCANTHRLSRLEFHLQHAYRLRSTRWFVVAMRQCDTGVCRLQAIAMAIHVQCDFPYFPPANIEEFFVEPLL